MRPEGLVVLIGVSHRYPPQLWTRAVKKKEASNSLPKVLPYFSNKPMNGAHLLNGLAGLVTACDRFTATISVTRTNGGCQPVSDVIPQLSQSMLPFGPANSVTFAELDWIGIDKVVGKMPAVSEK